MTDISVIVCVYNEEQHITGALRSVATQTLATDKYELIVVDDGSTDGTVDAIKETVEDFSFDFRILKNEKNEGLVHSANQGMREATGDYVVRLDGDDSFSPSALARLLKTRYKSDADLVYSDRFEVDAETGDTTYVRASDENLFSLVAAGTLMERQQVLDIGGYRNVFWEEYDLYIRYLRVTDGEKARVPSPLMVYLRHENSMTADYERVREGWAELIDYWGEETLKQYGTIPLDITTHGS